MINRSRSIFSCDVLIIGSGSADLRPAIEAYDSDVENVLIISQIGKVILILYLQEVGSMQR
jgi:hypothetical protein